MASLGYKYTIQTIKKACWCCCQTFSDGHCKILKSHSHMCIQLAHVCIFCRFCRMQYSMWDVVTVNQYCYSQCKSSHLVKFNPPFWFHKCYPSCRFDSTKDLFRRVQQTYRVCDNLPILQTCDVSVHVMYTSIYDSFMHSLYIQQALHQICF